MNTRSKKENTRKVAGLSHFQKVLTFIGSILGIITACITIYTFSSKSSAQSVSNTSSSTLQVPSNTDIQSSTQEGTTSSSSTNSSTSTADETT